MTDNVNIFENIIFRIPPLKSTVIGMLGAGLLYSILIYFMANTFTKWPADFPTVSLIVFSSIIISIIAGEISHHLLKEYPRKWGYFLSASNLAIMFIYGFILTLTNSFGSAWNVMWLGLISVFVSNIIVLLVSLSYEQVKRILIFSLIQPVSILVLFHLLLGGRLGIPFLPYLLNMFILIVAAVLILIALGVMEYLLRANTSGISVLELTSGLLQKSPRALDLGYPAKPDVQTLSIKTADKEFTGAIPWVHPGPLEGFGGGKLSSQIIEQLNKKSSGFFLHVPSTHKSDPSDPDDTQNLIDALGTPEKVSKVSKLVEETYGDITFYGRKLEDGKKIVFLDAQDFRKYDDFDVSIFREIIDTQNTVVVDLHSHDRNHKDVEECWYGTEDAEELRESFKKFLERLDSEKLEKYSAAIEVDTNGRPVMALIEDVGDQKTLILGIEGNGISKEFRSIPDSFQKEFDKVLCFSTDTHVSIHEMSADTQVDISRPRKLVERALENLSPAEIGIGSSKADEMKLLKEDYQGLIFSINILVRLLPLTLLLIYLGLVVWVI